MYVNKCLILQRAFLQTRSDCPGVIGSRWTGPRKENSESLKREKVERAITASNVKMRKTLHHTDHNV